jgi:hypothetical protein
MRRRYQSLLEVLFVFALAASVRLTSLGVFLVVDEEDRWRWAVDFYQALLAGDLSGTLVGDGYPGIFPVWLETIWLFGASLYRSLLNGNWLDEADVYLLIHEWSRLSHIALQRLPIVLANTLLVVGIFLYTRRLFGNRAALLAGILVGLDPFYLSDSRVNRAEALLTGLMTISLLALIAAHRWSSWKSLAVSGIFGGLAWLTKSQSLVLLPMFVVISLVWRLRAERDGQVGLSRWLVTMGVWAILAAGTFVILWPATWTVPGPTFNLMFDYLTHKAGTEGVKLFFLGDTILDEDPGLLFYPLTLVLRVTPLVLLGLLLGAWRLLRHARPVAGWRAWLGTSGAWALVAYVCLYVGGMSLGSHKQDRFLMAVFPALGILAALAFVHIIERRGWSERGVWLAGGLALALQLATTLPFHPYYYSYFNPLVGGGRVASHLTRVGWGEGMDQVADYFNAKPDAARLTVAARWYRYMLGFAGRTVPFDSSGQWTWADYMVFYIQQTQRMLDPSPGVIRYFRGREPEHVINIDGIEYAQIYRSPFTRAAQPRISQIPGQIALLGYRWEGEDAAQARRLPRVQVIWENQGLMETVSLQAAASDGHTDPRWQACQVAPGFEAAARTPGEVVESMCDLSLVTDAARPGAFDLRFGVAGEDGDVEEIIFPEGWRCLIKEDDDIWRPAAWKESLDEIARRLVPPSSVPVDVIYRGQIRLLAYDLSGAKVHPGQALSITLFWQALTPIEEDYKVFNHLFGLDGRVVGEADEFPPVPTSEWLPGQVVSTTHHLLTDAGVPPPALVTLDTGLYDAERRALPATKQDGRRVPVTLARIKLVPDQWPDQRPPVKDEVLFGDRLLLEGHALEGDVTPGARLNLQLWWRVRIPTDVDYTVFVHLLDSAGNIVAQVDGAPVDGRYPTSAWEVGETIVDARSLELPADLPAGEYQLILGLYNPVDGSRLPLAASEAQGADFVHLVQLSVN